MKSALKTPARMAIVGLLLTGFAGCGMDNPMAPSTSNEQPTSVEQPSVAPDQASAIDDELAMREGSPTSSSTTPTKTSKPRKPKKNKH